MCVCSFQTFVVAVELPLLTSQLVVKLAVKLHLQHLGQHEVTGGVRRLVNGQVRGGASREKDARVRKDGRSQGKMIEKVRGQWGNSRRERREAAAASAGILLLQLTGQLLAHDVSKGKGRGRRAHRPPGPLREHTNIVNVAKAGGSSGDVRKYTSQGAGR